MEGSAGKSIDFMMVGNLAKSKYTKGYTDNVKYGTAGFRIHSKYLNPIVYRMGLLIALRSQFKKATTGLMITASHNPEPDNGVKLVDPLGEMLEAAWEEIATKLANVDDDKVVLELQSIIKQHNIDTSFPASVIIGRDTRESSLKLSEAAIQGIVVLNGTAKDFGVITTPLLHYLIVSTNTNGAYGVATIEGYYEKLSKAFKDFLKLISPPADNNYKPKLRLDAANGVGAFAVSEFKKRLDQDLTIEVYNEGDGQLNISCGADHVKMLQSPPINLPIESYVRCCSIDGDADRIVYYYTDKNNKFHLMDGDRIAILVASYLKEQLGKSNLRLNLGLVQTAYANGGSTAYISKLLKVPVACVPTGVKHLHHKALEFDIGIYFEANGHGTVVFNNKAIQTIRDTASNTSVSKNQQQAAQSLNYIINVINQTVGDALSDMLLVELILYAKGWDIVTWEESYHDLPNKQVKVTVVDRNVITTTDAERRCISPIGLQEKIDEIVVRYPKGRSFVRPSGTEDIVRVYAECEKASDLQKLVAEVALAVYELAGGIGEKPSIPSENIDDK